MTVLRPLIAPLALCRPILSHIAGSIRNVDTEGFVCEQQGMNTKSNPTDNANRRLAVFGWVMNFDRKVPEAIEDILPPRTELPLPKLSGLRPMFSAVIVRETADRLYIEEFQPIDHASSIIASVAVKVQGTRRYVERGRLMLDHASPSDVLALAEFDRRQQDDHTERCRRAAEELLPIIRRYIDGAVQNEAEHADRIRELLDRLKPVT